MPLQGGFKNSALRAGLKARGPLFIAPKELCVSALLRKQEKTSARGRFPNQEEKGWAKMAEREKKGVKKRAGKEGQETQKSPMKTGIPDIVSDSRQVVKKEGIYSLESLMCWCYFLKCMLYRPSKPLP